MVFPLIVQLTHLIERLFQVSSIIFMDAETLEDGSEGLICSSGSAFSGQLSETCDKLVESVRRLPQHGRGS